MRMWRSACDGTQAMSSGASTGYLGTVAGGVETTGTTAWVAAKLSS